MPDADNEGQSTLSERMDDFQWYLVDPQPEADEPESAGT